MNKFTLALLAGAVIIGAAAVFLLKADTEPPTTNVPAAPVEPDTGTEMPEAEEPVADGAYTVDPDASEVAWTGRKTLIVGYEDHGILKIKEGSFTVAEGSINGRVVFDMTTIAAVKSGRGSGESMLSRHLQSDDFFAAETHPEATFVITGAAETADGYGVTGDLTIKDITHEVTLPASARMEDGRFVLDASTSLDRTLWDVRYGSDKFFDNLADNVIDDKFDVDLHIVADAG